jgi:hypothetical protein
VGWRGCPVRVTAPGVLGNDTDVEGDTRTASVVTSPTGGTLTLSPDGSFTYTPNTGTTGDSFTYRVFDGTDYSAPATVTLTLAAETVVPTGTVGMVVTASPTRVYVPLTVADGQSGVARVLLTSNSTNSYLEWTGPNGVVTALIRTPLVLPAAVLLTEVRVVKQNVSQRSRVEVRITDCAGNSTLVDPVIANLELKAGGGLERTFSGLPDFEYYLLLQNGSPGLASLQVWVNGKRVYRGSLQAGQTLRQDFGALQKAPRSSVRTKRVPAARRRPLA